MRHWFTCLSLLILCLPINVNALDTRSPAQPANHEKHASEHRAYHKTHPGAMEIAEIPKCPKCGEENSSSSRFCVHCGTMIKVDGCPQCGAGFAPRDHFCSQCGLDLTSKAKKQTEPPPSSDSTHRDPLASTSEPEEQSDAAGIPRMRIIGFADLNYQASDARGNHNAFKLGELALFITSHLSDKMSVLVENVIAADKTSNDYAFEIERLLFEYNANEYLKLAIGRYHTGIGYYNTAYHHGTWLQTAIGRPFLFSFEDNGGPLPIHNVGISASGQIPSGKLGLRYVAEIGNGRRSVSPTDSPVQNVASDKSDKALNFALIARPDALPGLQAGLSLYHDRLVPKGAAAVDETILAGHVVFQKPNFEFLNEAMLFHHKPAGSRSVDSFGFYSQISRLYGKWRPYLRYEYVNFPQSDPILGFIGKRSGPSLGMRYDIGDFAALKLQYDHTEFLNTHPLNQLTFQSSFTF